MDSSGSNPYIEFHMLHSPNITTQNKCADNLFRNVPVLYPTRSRWETYYGLCSRRDGARTSV